MIRSGEKRPDEREMRRGKWVEGHVEKEGVGGVK